MDHPKRILIVEDDVDIADVLSLHLRDERYEVVHCADGDEGLRLLEQGGWDALILDLMLPGVDGLEICRRARAMTRYTPIIITSARSSEVHRILGLELGADDYLAKPFSVLELVARVKALLRRVDAVANDLRLDTRAAGGRRHLRSIRLRARRRWTAADRTDAPRIRPFVLVRAASGQGVLAHGPVERGVGLSARRL